MNNYHLLFLFCLTIVASCKEKPGAGKSEISEENLRAYIKEMSGDDYAGRKPFTNGEEKTVSFLIEHAKRIGLQPGNGDSYTQDVPLTEITGHPSETLLLEGANQLALKLGTDYVGYTQRADTLIEIKDAEVLFCGYGTVAPEEEWNDFAGVDVKDKIVIVLVNDPGLDSPDSTFFKGKTMTYYGRWTYKFEEAARQGAAGIFIVHETRMAGYPWNVVREASAGAKLNLQSLPYTPCKMQGWISFEAATEIFKSADMDFEKAMVAAKTPGFKAISLPYRGTVTLKNEIRKNTSKNVVAMIPGTDQKDENIIFSAHWDHFGIATAVDGDSIYNGAIDNATGCASLLSIAEAMLNSGPYKRSVVFLWVTAEEQGLLGSAHYGANPIFQPSTTVANLNIDAFTAFGAMKDYSITGYGQSEMEDIAKPYVEKQGRYILPDQEPEKGYFFRSDHFNFAKIGIPALYAKGSYEHAEKGIEFAKTKQDEYRTKLYHQPADEYNEATWDMKGMIQDATIYLQVAQQLANSQEWPKWKEGSEFKGIREGKTNQ